jgi:hypothetical protein
VPTITFKVTTEEAANIRARAKASKRSLSQFLRDRLLGHTQDKRARLVRSDKTGILTVQKPAGRKPVTAEKVSELLSDFP